MHIYMYICICIYVYIYIQVISCLETDMLECEVKWALGSITMNKATGGDGSPVELF